MKVLVAAEDTGSIKALEFKLRDAKGVKTTPFAAEGRSSYIQKMLVIKRDGKQYILVARRGGVLQMYDAETYQQVREWKPASSTKGPIVGLEYMNDKIIMCTAKGQVISKSMTAEHSTITSIHSPVSCFRMHPNQPGIAAVGGKDREIEIVQVFPEMRSTRQVVPDTASMHRLAVLRLARVGFQTSSSDEEEVDAITEVDRRFRYSEEIINKSKSSKLWKSESAPYDRRGFPSPVWTSEVRFLSINRRATEGWRIAAATRYGEIRIYDTAVSKHPIYSVEVSHHPLVTLWFGSDESQLVYTDVQHYSGKFDSRTGRAYDQYRTAPGGSLQMDVSTSSHDLKTPTFMVSGGLDKQLRVYDLSNGELVNKIAVAARITSVALLDASDDNSHDLRGKKRTLESSEEVEASSSSSSSPASSSTAKRVRL